ncbi:MAG: UDP binding domain-containing protein [Pirellulaceae bacterium]
MSPLLPIATKLPSKLTRSPLLTEWDEFKTLDFKRIYGTMPQPAFVFDGRNILDRQALGKLGFEVHAIGKC